MYTLRTSVLLFFISFLGMPLSHAQEGCEVVVGQVLDQLTNAIRTNEVENSDRLIAQIRQKCGNNEVLQRASIIAKLISHQDAEKEIAEYFANHWDDSYMERIEAQEIPHAEDIYNRHPEKYHYVPIGHPIDRLITTKARAILQSAAFDLSVPAEQIVELFSNDFNNYLMSRQKEKPMTTLDNYIDSEHAKSRYSFALHAGIVSPIYAVNPTFKTNPIFGISVISPLHRKIIFDAHLKYLSLNNSEHFEMTIDDRPLYVKGRSSLQAGVSAGYKFLDINRTLSIAKVGIAYEGLMINEGLITQHPIDPSALFVNLDSYSSSYNVSFAVSAMQRINIKNYVGIQATAYYSPYNGEAIRTKINDNYFGIELFYRF